MFYYRVDLFNTHALANILVAIFFFSFARLSFFTEFATLLTLSNHIELFWVIVFNKKDHFLLLLLAFVLNIAIVDVDPRSVQIINKLLRQFNYLFNQLGTFDAKYCNYDAKYCNEGKF